MAKYKNSVADIELLPNVKKWNSVLVLEDDQEVSCVFLLLHIHICFEVLTLVYVEYIFQPVMV